MAERENIRGECYTFIWLDHFWVLENPSPPHPGETSKGFVMHFSVSEKTKKPFSLKIFVITVFGSLIAYNVLVAIIMGQFFPKRWALQVSASNASVFWTFVGMSFFNCFVEYFFHRYVLHARVVWFLSPFYRKHTRHHGLTPIAFRPHRESTPTIENRFPIIREEQHEASFFPWYAFVAFTLVATTLFIAVHWLFPRIPIFLGGSLGIASSLFLYEVLHAISHWPIEKWKPLITHRRFGRAFRYVYAFHAGHHVNVLCNESVSGFFGLPLADLVFGTLVLSPTWFPHGETPSEREMKFKMPRRARFIVFLDRFAARSHRSRSGV